MSGRQRTKSFAAGYFFLIQLSHFLIQIYLRIVVTNKDMQDFGKGAQQGWRHCLLGRPRKERKCRYG